MTIGAHFSPAQVADWLARRPEPLWLVGGAVRDTLLRSESAALAAPRDLDVAVAGDALALARSLAGDLGGAVAPLDPAAGLVRVTWPGGAWHCDIARLAGATIEDDLARRDFTINAIALPVTTAAPAVAQGADLTGADLALIDPFGGRDDLARRRLRVVSEHALTDDPVRVLRAARLAAKLDLAIDGATVAQARALAARVAAAPPERITSELYAMLAGPDGTRATRLLDELGALTAIVPPLAPCRGILQREMHHWDVFDHSLAIIDSLDRFVALLGAGIEAPELARREDERVIDGWRLEHPLAIDLAGRNAALMAHLNAPLAEGQTRLTLLKTAALFHDVGKPDTRDTSEGRVRFPGHAEAGVPLAAPVLRRWRLGRAATRFVTTVVACHMRPGHMAGDGRRTLAAMRHYFADTGNAALDVALFSLADHFAVYGPTPLTPFWLLHREAVTALVRAAYDTPGEMVPPRLISGNDLVRHFGLAPGALVGSLLERVRAAQLDGAITSPRDALVLVESLLSARDSAAAHHHQGDAE